MDTKTNRKYRALLFLLIVMSLFFPFLYIVSVVIFSLYIYMQYGDFVFNFDLYIACKVAILGFPSAILIWFGECRRLGIKIFGK